MRTFLPSYLILYIDTYNQPLQDSPEHIIIQTRWVSLTFLIKNKNIKLNNWTLWARIAHWSFLLSKDNWQQHEIRVWHRILLWPVRKQAWTPFFFRAVLILWRSDSTRSWKHSPDKTWDAIWILNVQRTSLRSPARSIHTDKIFSYREYFHTSSGWLWGKCQHIWTIMQYLESLKWLFFPILTLGLNINRLFWPCLHACKHTELFLRS